MELNSDFNLRYLKIMDILHWKHSKPLKNSLDLHNHQSHDPNAQPTHPMRFSLPSLPLFNYRIRKPIIKPHSKVQNILSVITKLQYFLSCFKLPNIFIDSAEFEFIIRMLRIFPQSVITFVKHCSAKFTHVYIKNWWVEKQANPLSNTILNGFNFSKRDLYYFPVTGPF